ncbi:MAG: ABC transporter ATP-binding protein [Pseudomonadota bacterium]|nr:ABC transporter ATP-binding protein [Pseudomonadota bacterium]
MATDSPGADDVLLSVEGLNAFYGDSHVLHDLSFRLPEGRLLVLLGRNGAGKSTTIHSLVGFLAPRGGRVRFAGQEIQAATPEAISMAGMALVPQGRRIFGSLSVRENLEVGARRRTPRGRRCWTFDEIFTIFPRLKERQKQLAASLSGGEQQMLAIGRALMTNPRLLLLDEPSEGLAPQIVHEVQEVLLALKSQVSIVLVEQNLALATAVADEVLLLDNGRAVFAGSQADFAARQADLQVHLGVT